MVGAASVVLRKSLEQLPARPLTEFEAAVVLSVCGGAMIGALVLLIPLFRDKPEDFVEELLAIMRERCQKNFKRKGLFFWKSKRKF